MARRQRLVATFLALWLPAIAVAAPGDPTEEEMIRALAPRPSAPAGPATAVPDGPGEADDASPAGEAATGLRLRGRKAVTARVAQESSAGAMEGRLQLSVQFELGSAAIREESRELLARLGRAMASPALAGLAYRIEGHTDSTGGAALNQRLSERRAESVTAFLISATGISEDRFVPVGFGSSQLLDPANPEAAANRRVVVVSLERPAAAPVAAAKPAAPEPAAAAAAPTPGAAIALGNGGRLQLAKGAIEVRKPASDAPARVETGARLEEGDVISAGPGASALVQFDDGAHVIIRPDSSVKLAKLKHSGEGLGQLVQVITGACRYVTGSLGRARPQAVALSTPTATVGIRGTDLEVAYREEGRGAVAPGTYVRVNDGGVRVGGLDGTQVELAKGEQAFAGRPRLAVRGKPALAAVRRLDAPAGVFGDGELDALLPSR